MLKKTNEIRAVANQLLWLALVSTLAGGSGCGAIDESAIGTIRQASCSGTVYNHTANSDFSVLASPHVYIVFWGAWDSTNDPYNNRETLRGFLESIGGTSYLNVVTQYDTNNHTKKITIPVGSNFFNRSTDVWFDPSNPGSSYPNRAALDAEVKRALGTTGGAGWTNVPQDAVVVVAVSNTVGVAPYCGSHWSTTVSPFTHHIAYIDLPYTNDAQCCYPTPPSHCNAQQISDGATKGAMHELEEALVNPRGAEGIPGWREDCPNPNDGEIADLCNDIYNNGGKDIIPIAISPGTVNYGVKPVWSLLANNGSGGCVYSYSTRRDRFIRSTTSTLMHSTGNGTTWDSWGTPPNLPLSDAPGAVSWSNGRMDAFVRAGFPAKLYHAYWPGADPAIWDPTARTLPTGWTFIGHPDVASYRPKRLDIVAVGQSGSSVHLFHWYYDNGAWGGSDPVAQDWGTLPNSVPMSADGGSAVAVSLNRVDVFILSNQSPTHLYHGSCGAPSCNNAVPLIWEDLGAGPAGYSLYGSPDAASPMPGTYEVFVPTTTGDLARYSYNFLSGGAWMPVIPHPANNSINPSPGAVGGGTGRFWVSVGAGSSGNVYENVWDYGSTCSGCGWNARGSATMVKPDMTSW